MIHVRDRSTGFQTRRSHLGKGHIGMRLQVFLDGGFGGEHLAWVLPTDGLREAARELVPGDFLLNEAGYLYYIARSGAYLPCGHLVELGVYRRALLHLKREEHWLFDVGVEQQAQLKAVIARQARSWIETHEQQSAYASFETAFCAWQRSLSGCPCGDLFCVCLYRFPCPSCGVRYTVVGAWMHEAVERQGRCTSCAGQRVLVRE